MNKKVAVIGGGFTGLSATYDLAKAGFDVSIFEAERDLGGLAGSFEVSPGRYVEKFYHHWFTSDLDILNFIDELGLSGKLKYINSNTGLFYANSIFRLASPLDLLKFQGIPLIDRFRTGLMALYARVIDDYKPLECITAEDWIKKIGGKRAFEVIWSPLLKGKFGSEASEVSATWFWNKLKLRGGSRDKKGKESLVYFEGGFGAVVDAIRSSLEDLGVQINLSSPVDEVCAENGIVKGIKLRGTFIPFDVVLSTVPLPVFLAITPAIDGGYRARAEQIRFLGNVCIVLRMKQSLSSTYWMNIADPDFPFVGIIEHTNLDDRSNYGGEHIAYLSKYMPTSDPLFNLSDDEYLKYCLPYVRRIVAEFDERWLHGVAVWRAKFSQPVITKYYSSFIPEIKTPIQGLWCSTMAQVYPEDRGTSYAVRGGRRVAKEIVEAKI